MIEQWYVRNWDIARKYCFNREGDPKRWGRIVCPWYEKKEMALVQNIAVPLVDLELGTIWVETSKTAVYIKFCAQVIIRPIYSICKTAYHIWLPFSIPYEIAIGIEEGFSKKIGFVKTAKLCCLRSLKSIADIARTPLYGLALTVHALAAVIILPFKAHMAYEMMQTSGKIEQSLYWGKHLAPGTLFRCFQPFNHVEHLHGFWANKNKESDTFYRPKEISSDRSKKFTWGLSNYGRALVCSHRKDPLPCFLFQHYKEVGPYNAYVSDFLKELHPLATPDSTFAPSKNPRKMLKVWETGCSRKDEDSDSDTNDDSSSGEGNSID